MVYNRVG